VRCALVIVVLAIFGGCTQPRSDRCKKVCTKEYECVTQTNSTLPFDEKECIAACSVLENDPDNLAKVQKHYDCVLKNELSCQAVLDCE
jgi:hypothetical protein